MPPQGAGENSRRTFRTEDQQANAGEAALLAALTRAVAAEFAVPADAIFAAGLSAGGAMSATLAATHPGLFAAVGIHSGLPHGIAHDMPSAFAAMRGQAGSPPRPGAGSAGRAPGDGVGGRARSPSVAQRATGVTLAAIAGLRRRFGLRDLEPDGDDDDRRENGADRAG